MIPSGMVPKTTRVLMAMVVPGHLLFIYAIHFMEAGHTSITLMFTSIYLTAAIIQVLIAQHYKLYGYTILEQFC